MTPATEALIAEVREYVARIQRSGEDIHITDLENALADLDSETCDAEMDHHHGRLTCVRRPGHSEVRHRDYLRGEWNAPEAPTGNSRTERMER